jgi:transcriptional regulator with XRE-family HTH domain
MTDALHNVQQAVKQESAHGAIVEPDRSAHYLHMNLARIREARGLTQRDLADMIGMDASTVNRAEKGAPSAKLDTYKKCAIALGVTLSDIFSAPLSASEATLLEKFKSIPEQHRAQILALFDLVRTDTSPATQQTLSTDPVSTDSTRK